MDWSTHVKWGPLMMDISITVLIVISLAIMCSEETSGALIDEEIPPDFQYQDWDAAYNLTDTDLGSKQLIRKDGGGDADFLRMSFLSIGDLVTLELDHPIGDRATLEYYVSDPNRFPIRYHYYDGTGPNIVRLEFQVTLEGPYFFHVGQGFGDTIFSMNITRVSTPSTGDENDRPEDALPFSSTTIIHDNFGQPYDPSDFYRLELAPSETEKVFLSFTLSIPDGAEGQWELYTSSGIERGSQTYTLDCRFGDSEIKFFDRITSPDSYFIRVWCNVGDGDYTLSIEIATYPNDGNDLLAEALEIWDGDDFNGTLHTEFDLKDHFKINLFEGDRLQLWLYVDDDADLRLLNETGAQLSISDNWNEDSEYISYLISSEDEGYYYISVYPSTELDLIPSRNIGYRLRVLVNLPPQLDNDYARTLDNWQITEDTVDDRIELARLFRDPEGGPLSFTVITDFNGTLLEVTITVADRLRLEPGENLSGFIVPVTVVAKDNRGKMANFTVQVAVTPVNDAPVVGHPSLPPPPESLEMDEDIQGGPWDALDWFWDVDNDRMDLNILLSPSDEIGGAWNGLLFLNNRIPDWCGNSYITLTARDPGGLVVDLRILVIVRSVNDPPRDARITPVSQSPYTQSEVIPLSGSAVDDDGDILSFKWILDGGEEVGQGRSVNLSGLSIGAHEVTLVVHDGIDGTEAVLSFDVIKDEERSDGGPFVVIWMIGVIVIILVLALVVGSLMIRRQRTRVGSHSRKP